MSSVEEFNCILCKESFDNKDELQIHFRKHGDPKFNESIKSKSRVQNVAPVANEKSNYTPEMVNCDVCDELFPTISKAITHKHKLHPDHDANYFCPWCGKLFTLKHLYNKHLQANHEAVDGAVEKNDSHFHCDSCDVFFFIPAAMIYHNKFFHRQDTELPLIGHSKKRKLFNQDLLPVYYCSFCGEEFINKVNLHKHICDDHNDENQRPTDVLRCPLCEAIFYHLDAYELHLTFHSSEDLYSEMNEMNETDITEFSLETVPPDMERIEDLNNIPEDENNTSAVGIESFLQMAMDESHDGSQVTKKSKKHKKHKKTKKSAITLDEFLNMNQDVFGEDLDFQGIEEVPTKVIKRQLKPKKPQLQKTAVKFASSADLEKLQKQGIVVKMKPGNKPPPLQVKDIGQTVKISSRAKNVINQTSTKAISASNEVLSKLMNQSNNQLKIVKKPVQEKVHISEEVQYESTSKEEKSEDEDSKNVHMDLDNDLTKSNIEINLKPTSISTSKIIKNNIDSQHSNDSESNYEPNQSTIAKGSETENDHNVNNVTCSKEYNQDITEINSHKKETTNVNDGLMKDTLKNISSQITIKPVNQSNKARIHDKPDESKTQKIDNYEDVTADINSDTDTEQTNENTKIRTVDTLKNINSAITIKSLKNKSLACDNKITSNENTEQNPKEIHTNVPGNVPVQKKTQFEKDDSNVNNLEDTKEKLISTSSSHVLKNLSKNITIKSVSPAVKQIREDVSENDQYHSDFEEDENDVNDRKNINRGANPIPVTHKNINPRLKVDPDANQSTHTYANVQTVYKAEEKGAGCDELPLHENIKITNTQSSNNLLKHLKNITAKPVTTTKNTRQQIAARCSNVSTSIIKSNNSVKSTVQKNEVSEEIEIFNIDDSDSDGTVTEQPKLKQPVSTSNRLEPTKPVIQSNATLHAIKNISKHVTVKSSSQAKQTNSIKKEKIDFDLFSDEDDTHDGAANASCDDSEDKPLTELKKVTLQSTKQKADAFQSVFKNLGKHITIKSRNASPSPSVKSTNHVLKESSRNNASNDEESDTDSGNGNVKITEMTEDNMSDDDVDTSENKGVVVQSPENSNSGNEYFSEEMEEFDDDGSKIPSKDSKTSHPDIKSNNDFLKHISKNITVRSLNERTLEKHGTINTPHPDKETIMNQNNLSNNMSIKSVKQKSDIQNENVKFRSQNSGVNKQNTDTASSCRPTMNSKPTQSPGVVNVNKEVKVKTYQSETVIEEITTTVTKTIRRVNQVNQQVYNASPAKEQGPRMIQQNNGPRILNQPRNVQGVSVRQSPPVLGPKIRQALPFRPRNSTSVRPSNQLVPVRPNTNQVRPMNNPRMQVKNMPNQQRPIGKPLKISPNAMNQTMKRPATEENSGPFSCFKKPKESLIPETALESGSDFHYASTSQINKFSSTTKTIKDNTVVTSKQMKSESTSQQLQMSRNSNVTGLKITKAKQVNEVERTEMSASKRTTLEAIEKLQKQGLLVKKPRLEDEFEPPDSEADDNNQIQD